jgi:hypothetical protein
MFYLALLLFVAVAVYSQTFTGDVEKDFNGPAVIIVPDPGLFSRNNHTLSIEIFSAFCSFNVPYFLRRP